MTISYETDLGTRGEQQDRFVVQAATEGIGVHVLDGHGDRGEDVVTLAATCLENDILPKFDVATEGPEIVRGLQNVCGRFDKSGSTLSSVYVFGNKSYAFILGDSPVICVKGETVFRVPIHDITNKEETQKRIEAGLYERSDYPKHLFLDKSSGLSCFRSIGDTVFGDKLGREPEMHELPDWDYIIVATDGLKINDKDIVSNVAGGAKSLLQANLTFLIDKHIDNTTVVVLSK